MEPCACFRILGSGGGHGAVGEPWAQEGDWGDSEVSVDLLFRMGETTGEKPSQFW